MPVFSKNVQNSSQLWVKNKRKRLEWEQSALCADIIPLTSATTQTWQLRACWWPASVSATAAAHNEVRTKAANNKMITACWGTVAGFVGFDMEPESKSSYIASHMQNH